MELQFVHSPWMVYLADHISLCGPLKRVFYRQNALEGKWHTFKGKGGIRRKRTKFRSRNARLSTVRPKRVLSIPWRHKTCVTVQFVKILSSVKFLSHIFVSDIYGPWDPVHLKKLWKSCALRAVWMASVKMCGRNHINLIN